MTSSQYAFVITSRLIIVLLPLFADSTTFRTGHSVVPGHHRRAPTAGDVTGSDASTAVHGESASTVDSSAAVDLKCPPCDRIHCWPRRASRLRCPGGIVRGICDCCPVCARLEGQTCGGQWNYLGRCDAGLHCSANTDADGAGDAAGGSVADGGSRVTNRVYTKEQSAVNREKQRPTNAVWKPPGICQQGQEMNDSPLPTVKCFPLCTPEFCRQNPKQLCSAIDNAERRQPCQADCQHTSCSACRYRRPSMDCSKTVRCASPSDTECLRRFGRCVRRQQCASRVDFPCRTNNDVRTLLGDADFKFVCDVPECPTSTS